MAQSDPIIRLTPYSASAVMGEYGVMPEETVLRAAVQSIYNFMAGEPRFNPNDRADSNKAAVEETILRLQFRIPALRAYEEDFFGQREYDRDALTVACVCGSALDKSDENYDPLFFHNLNLVDPTLEERADAIREEASLYYDRGLTVDDIPTKEALFLVHLEAFDTVKSALFDHYTRGSAGLQDLSVINSDMLATVPSYLQERTEIGHNLYDNISKLYDLCRSLRPQAQVVDFPQPPTP